MRNRTTGSAGMTNRTAGSADMAHTNDPAARGRGPKAAAPWHVGPAMGARYASGTLPEPDAWSLEKHVEACARCAATVSAAVAATDAGPVLGDVRAAVLRTAAAEGPAQAPRAVRLVPGGRFGVGGLRGGRLRTGLLWTGRPHSTRLRAGRLPAGRLRPVRPLAARLLPALRAAGPALRGAWLCAVLLVCVVAVVLAYGAGSAAARPVLLTLAPLLPVSGVALSYGPYADPAYEIGAGSPSGGLRLLLVRTAAVLAVSLPPLTLVGALLPGAHGVPGPAAWLLPGLALTLGTLALGSFLGCRTAAGLLAGGWACAVPLPALVAGSAGSGGAVLPAAALGDQVARCLSGPAAQGGWAAAAALCCALLVLRRRAFDFVPGGGGSAAPRRHLRGGER